MNGHEFKSHIINFCSTNKISLEEEKWIGEKILGYAGLQDLEITNNKSGRQYNPLVAKIAGMVPGAKNTIHGGRLNELFNRDKTNNLKQWRKAGFFDCLYQFIAIHEGNPQIKTRSLYLIQHPELIHECYEPEEITELSGSPDLFRLLTEWLHKKEPDAAQPEPVPEAGQQPEKALREEVEQSKILVEKEKKRTQRLQIISIGLGALSIILAMLLLQTNKAASANASQSLSIHEWDLTGDSIGSTSIIFRSRENPDTIWPFARLSLFRLKNAIPGNQERDTVCIARLTGVYRKSDNSWAPNEVIHIGLATKAGNFLQFDLEAMNKETGKEYGKWFATLYIPDGRIQSIFANKNTYCFGMGGGISNYTANDNFQNKISSYILMTTNDDVKKKNSQFFLNQMLGQVDLQPTQSPYQHLRIVFSKKQ